MTRIEGGKIKLEESSASLAEILNGLSSITQTEIAQRSISFHVVAENLLHEDVICDKLRLNQILLNCLSNAIKYTPEGGVVTLLLREIWNEKTDYSLYEFCVKDTGIGMAPEFLDHIFEPFERERNSTISGIQGTGLGMTITKNLVDLMGGQISVRSEVGKGSEFFITLKFQHSIRVPSSSLESYRGKRALVVGSTNACHSAASSFFRLGLEVSTVTSLDSVLELAPESSVFFVDHSFTDHVGIEVGKRILEKTKSTEPILILAFYHLDDEAKKRAKENGFEHFLMKPIFTSDLENTLLSHLEDEGDTDTIEKNFDLKGKHVLVVEDNALNRDIASFILTDAGMEVEFAENGKLGYVKVRDHEAN
ncbi:MAG: hypothetical protein KBS81_10690, partial [Spirochaetales bacterium]|nr:hypothetical protein [Candidatus Physcosoma equi]